MEETWWTKPEQLDKYQTAVVALPEDQDHLVVGPAGSGKTNLLVLRAAHLHGSGIRNISVLTFGRVLREFLSSGSGNYELPPNRFRTYVGWGRHLLEENEIPFDDSGDFSAVRTSLLLALRDLAALRRPENVADCILLDEAQDYTREELETIRKFTRRLFAAGDDRQRVYRGRGALDYLRSTVHSVKELPYHYRNGLKICRVADGIRNLVGSDDGMEATSNYDEKAYPSSVLVRPGLAIEAQVAAACPDIERQLRAYPEGLVGVLCPRNRELTDAYNELIATSLADQVQLHQGSEGYEAFDPDRRVVLATVHGAKGLEFRAVHAMGMDKIARFPNRQRNIAYTAVTRAKTSLTIYHEDPLLDFIDHGITAATIAASAPPQLASLFKTPKGATR
jgi:superfamily I DNA/RNA helicase